MSVSSNILLVIASLEHVHATTGALFTAGNVRAHRTIAISFASIVPVNLATHSICTIRLSTSASWPQHLVFSFLVTIVSPTSPESICQDNPQPTSEIRHSSLLPRNITLRKGSDRAHMVKFSAPIVGTKPRTSQSKFIVQGGTDLSPTQRQMKLAWVIFPCSLTVPNLPKGFEATEEVPTI